MLVGTSPGFQRAHDLMRRAARTQVTVLLTGETGVGKERFARALHAHSERAAGSFVAVNCAALPAELIEAELFGVEKAPSPAPTPRGPAASSAPRVARCSSTRSATCRCRRRPSCCASCRKRDRAPGQRECAQGECAAGGGDQRQPRSGGRARPVPARPVLPPQRLPGLHPAAARAPVGHRAARAPPAGAFHGAAPQAAGRLQRPRAAGALAPRLAGQCARAGRTWSNAA